MHVLSYGCLIPRRIFPVTSILLLVSCSFTGPNLLRSAPQVVLIDDQAITGTYQVDAATSVAYEYTWRAPSNFAPGQLEIKFDLRSTPPEDTQLGLFVLDADGRPMFSSLLFAIDAGTNMTGTPRAFHIELHRGHSFSIIGIPGDAGTSTPVARGEGIVLQEGERITGTLQRWGNTSAAVRYTYSYHYPRGTSPGNLDMEFELINGEIFSEMVLELVIVGEDGRALAGGLLFERRNGTSLTRNTRTLRIEPYNAAAFGFIGGGFYQGSLRTPRQSF